MAQPPGQPDEPRTLLVNGRGAHACAHGDENGQCEEQRSSPAEFVVEQGNTYLLRLIAATTQTYQSFAVDGHKLTIIRSDGQDVKPVTVESLDINSGERYDVLLTADRPPGVYYMQWEYRFQP